MSPRLAAADGEEIKSAALRFFEAGLCCAVEAERELGWEPRLLVFASAAPARALGAVEATLSLLPGRRVRIVGYDPARLCPVPLPAALVCSPRR